MPDLRRKATLKDVARESGVHVSTVSRALNPDKRELVNAETRDQIEEVARRLDYRPDRVASSLRRGRTGVIGVVVADLGNPFVGPVLHGIENGLGGDRIMPMVVESRDDSTRLERVCDALIDHRVDAVITTAGRSADLSTLQDVADLVPLVLVVRTLPELDVATFAHDDRSGGRLAAEHLLGLGHRRLAQLVGPDDISSFRHRRAGFAEAAGAAGLPVTEIADETAALPTLVEGRALMRRLLEQHRDEPPTGVFVHNDSMAVGAIEAIRDAGLDCPRDVSVVGYNNSPLDAYLDPPLTTIELPGYDLGRMAAETLVGLLDEPAAAPPRVNLPARLVERASTAVAP